MAGWIAGAGLALGFLSSRSASNAQDRQIQAQYDYDMANYAIQLDYHDDLLGFRDQQLAFQGQQLGFAYQQKAYAEEQYAVGLANIAAETAYRERAVYNQKMAANAQYTAEVDVAHIMQAGAEDAMNTAIEETLRVGSANIRENFRQAVKAVGDTQAQNSGITGGSSRDRELVDVYMQKNRAEAQIKDQIKGNMIQSSRAKDEMVNNYTIKTAESYRNLTAIMKLEAQPVPNIAGPQPVFLGVPPIGPVTPVGAAPIKGASSSSTFSNIAQGLSTGTSAVTFANAIGAL